MLRKENQQLPQFYNDDLRFKTWNEVSKPESRLSYLAMMDTSGSMGTFEKYMCKKLFLLDDSFFTYKI